MLRRNLLITLSVSIFTFLLSGCNWSSLPMSTLHVVTEWGHDINHVYAITAIVTGLVGIVVAGLMVYVLWRFKERPGDTTIPKQVHGNFKLELLWSIIPCILLIFIVVPTWEVIFKHSVEPPEDALHVHVIGHQWWWEFQYPKEGITTAGELHLPENTPVYITMWSADVIHSFWVPKFGGKMDVLPGHKNYQLITTPEAKAEGGDFYQGQCVELCGASHALMRFQAVVHKKKEWDRWVKSHNTAPVVETSKEKRGLALMSEKGCNACHAIHGTDLAGTIGPNLTNLGNRRMVAAGVFMNTQEGLGKWLSQPEVHKPGSLMPNLQLSEAEVSDLTAFLRNTTIKAY